MNEDLHPTENNVCDYLSMSKFNLIFVSEVSCLLRSALEMVPIYQISINSLGPSDAIWRQRSGSTLAQVMACCLMAPSHYLNQCWLIINNVEWHSSKGKFTRDTSAINHWNYLENQVPKISFKFPWGQWVNNSLEDLKLTVPSKTAAVMPVHFH